MSTAGMLLREPPDWTAEMAAIAQRRDQEAFLRVYDHFMPRLCLYLRGLGCTDATAEDLAQEALLRLWLHAGAYDAARSAVSTWLFRIARNLHIDRLRREALRPQVADAELDLDAASQPRMPRSRPTRCCCSAGSTRSRRCRRGCCGCPTSKPRATRRSPASSGCRWAP